MGHSARRAATDIERPSRQKVEGEGRGPTRKAPRMTDRRYYVTLVFVFLSLALILGTISEVMK